jgi:hypothetical protein
MGDITVGGNISYKEFERLRKEHALVIVCGEVYGPTLQDRWEMAWNCISGFFQKMFRNQ